MATDYVFNQQNSLTVVDSDALLLASGDTVLVEAGGSVRATGTTGNGIVSTASNNAIVINGLVSSPATAAGTSGIKLNNGGAITIGETGQVSGDFGMSFNGSTIIRNRGEINGLGPLENAIASIDATADFSLYNSGNIHGNIDLLTRSSVLSNNGFIDGNVVFRNSGSIYDGRGGAVTGSVRLLESSIAYGGSHSETFDAGRGGDNVIHGGAGNDTVVLSPEGSTITVDLRLNDRQIITNITSAITLTGIENITVNSGGRVTLTGDNAANILRTGVGNDSLLGGEGNDTLDGGYSNDTLDGGDGFDTVTFARAEALEQAVFVNMANPNDARNTYGADTYISIEALVGTSLGDTFIGNADANTFTGGKGNDTLDGGGGVNTAVFSGPASDYTVTKNGDTITVQHLNNGDDGTDTLTNIRFARFEADNKTVALINSAPVSVALSNATVAENAANAVVGRLSATDADGDAVSYAIAGDPDGVFAIRDGDLVVTRALDFEAKAQHSVTVTAKDAWGGETSQSFTVSVTDLADTGGGTPGAVNLVLRGTSTANVLTGQAGNDTLYGRLGKDVLTGGAGQDVFVFDTRPNSRTNVDTITDFSVADDSIQLDNRYLKKLGSGSASSPKKLKAAFFKVADKAKDKDDYLVYNRKTGVLSYDEDGSGAKAAVAIAKLANKASLTKNDFFVI